MTASVLSLTVISGLKSFHKARLQSKQRLTKKTRRKSGSHNRSRQHVIPCLLVGWFWSNRIWSGRPIVTPGQSAGQPAQTRPGFLILVTCVGCGICWKGGGGPHGLACFSSTMRRSASPLKKCGLHLSFVFFLLSKSWLVRTAAAKQRGNRDKQGERPGDCCCRGSGVIRRQKSAYIVKSFPMTTENTQTALCYGNSFTGKFYVTNT